MNVNDIIYNVYSFCYDQNRLGEVSTTFHQAQEQYVNATYPFWNKEKKLCILYLQYSSLRNDWNSFMKITRLYSEDIKVLADAIKMSHCNDRKDIAEWIYLNLVEGHKSISLDPAISYYELKHHPDREEQMIKDGKWEYIEPCMIPFGFDKVCRHRRVDFKDDFYHGSLSIPTYPTIEDINIHISNGYTAGCMKINQGWWCGDDDKPIYILYNKKWDEELQEMDLKDQEYHISYRMAKAIALDVPITEDTFK